MKNLLLIFSVLLSTSLSAIEYGYLSQEQPSISLSQGDVIEFLAMNRGCEINITLPNGNQIEFDGWMLGSESGSTWNSKKNHIFVGPITISLYQNDSHYLAYQITRASEYQNSNVFSVNGGPSSTHNIVVETSTDLENWTPVHSSGLTGSSEQIYVRTRISTSE
ncbi:MAG: hypothetical protein ACJZ9L_05370 [Coraliomargaritaceae bacterium]